VKQIEIPMDGPTARMALSANGKRPMGQTRFTALKRLMGITSRYVLVSKMREFLNANPGFRVTDVYPQVMILKTDENKHKTMKIENKMSHAEMPGYQSPPMPPGALQSAPTPSIEQPAAEGKGQTRLDTPARAKKGRKEDQPASPWCFRPNDLTIELLPKLLAAHPDIDRSRIINDAILLHGATVSELLLEKRYAAVEAQLRFLRTKIVR
jgi:hypothetical protein